MKLRPDLVLVALPPARDESPVQLVTPKGDLDTYLLGQFMSEQQRPVKAQPVDQPIGRVVQVGALTHDVWPGDLVLLEPSAGQDVDIPDEAGRPRPHLLIREADITAVLERT